MITPELIKKKVESKNHTINSNPANQIHAYIVWDESEINVLSMIRGDFRKAEQIALAKLDAIDKELGKRSKYRMMKQRLFVLDSDIANKINSFESKIFNKGELFDVDVRMMKLIEVAENDR